MRISHKSPTRDDPLATALGVGVLALFAAHVFWLNGVAEDAYISFHYAQNLVAGRGLVWNVGEAPVEGYTNFLWVLISAGILALDIDLPIASQWLGFAAGAAAIAIIHRSGTRRLGWSARYALLPCVALAFSGPFAAWSGAGLETIVFSFFIVASLHLLSNRSRETRSRGLQLHLGLAALLLAALTRPEGLVIAACIATIALAGHWTDVGEGIRRYAGPIALYAGLFVAYFVWRWGYFGDFLPNTFHAKTGGGMEQLARGLRYCGLFALHFLTPWLPLVALAGFVSRSSRSVVSPADAAAPENDGTVGLRRWVVEQRLLPSCALIVVVYTLYIAAVGGDYMAMDRFFAPLLPLIYLLLAAAVRPAFAGEGHEDRRAIAGCLLVVALLGTLVHSTPIESAFVEKPELMHGNYRGVETERWYVARHRLIGEFFARYGEPRESIATAAIGAIAYYSGLRVQDLHGIVDRHIAHHGTSKQTLGLGLPGHEKSDYPYVFDQRPTFYMFNRRLYEKPLPGIPLLSPDVDERVRREYVVRSVWLEDVANGEAGYFAFLERRDRQRSSEAPTTTR